MSEIAEASPTGTAHGLLPPRDWRPVAAGLAMGAAYYAGARIGLALTFEPSPLSVLWPPNALLFAGLLLAPARWWWLLILGAFPAHLLAETQGGVPAPMVLCWFVSNVTEGLIGAAFVRRHVGEPIGLGTTRQVMVFGAAAVLAPFLSSFLDAGFVRLIGWRSADYWSLWQARFFSNMLSTLVFVPVVVTFAAARRSRRPGEHDRAPEAVLLLAGLLAVSIAAFDFRVASAESATSLLYLPVPFLLWAALRFGPLMTSGAFGIFAFLVIWGAGHGNGPFTSAATHENAFPIQLFLITIALPMLLLAALMEERRNAEARLRASEALFSTAFRSSPDAIALSRARDGHVLEANDRWLELLGYEPDALARGSVGPLSSHVDEADRAKIAALAGDDAELRDAEVTLRDRHGNHRRVLVRIKAVELQGQPCAIGIMRDVTAQREAEVLAREQGQQLTHVTRVASLTEFSSTLAHELKQPLAAILCNAQAALRFLSRDPPDLAELRFALDDIAEADMRAGRLIHHLRLLTKRGDEEIVPIDVNELVREVLELLHGEFITRGVAVSVELAADSPSVDGDRVQLQQVMLNLLSNACDAMETSARAERRIFVRTARDEDGVRIEVGDTGRGIAPDRLEQVFEPFYTTKTDGLGLGLAISRKIARTHGGELTAAPRDGGGATLRLMLRSARSGVVAA